MGIGFVAVTAHWCHDTPSGELNLRSELVSLRRFDYPDNIDADDRVFEVMEGLGRAVLEKVNFISFS